jgi:hypothetical protein
MKSRNVLLAGITATLTLTAPAPAATAATIAPGTCLLQVADAGGDFVRVTLTCANRANGDNIDVFKLYGEDVVTDNLLYTVATRTAQTSLVIHENYLNEDISDRDEIYATAWIRKPNGSVYRISSNKLTGWWGIGWCCLPPGKADLT